MDIEKAVLPHLVNKESLQYFWDEGIRPEHFVDDLLKSVFDYSVDYFVRFNFKDAPTREILEHRFPSLKNMEWPEEYLSSFIKDELLSKYKKNNFKKILVDSASLAEKDSLDGAINNNLAELIKLQQTTTRRSRIRTYSSTYGNRVESYFDDLENNNIPAGLPLGFDALNAFTNGIYPSEVAVLVGAPNVGKSYLLAQMAKYAAENKTKVYYASLENTPKAAEMRLDCLFANIPFTQYLKGNLDFHQQARLRAAKDTIESLEDYLLIDTPLYKSERTVVELYSRARHWGAELVVGDQLSWVTSSRNYSSENSSTLKMEEIFIDIVNISREMKLASVWGAQFNRQGAKKRKGGGLQDIAKTSAIEEYADFAFGLSASKEMASQEHRVLELMKARRTEKITWLLKFFLKQQTLIDIVKEYDEDDDASGLFS